MSASTEQIARDLLASNGEPSPHPALLADTMNEVTYSGLDVVRRRLRTMPAYTVEKNVYDVPCDHPMCDPLHQDLPPWHEWQRTEWVILEDGERKGRAGPFDAFPRKRDALDALRHHGLA